MKEFSWGLLSNERIFLGATAKGKNFLGGYCQMKEFVLLRSQVFHLRGTYDCQLMPVVLLK